MYSLFEDAVKHQKKKNGGHLLYQAQKATVATRFKGTWFKGMSVISFFFCLVPNMIRACQVKFRVFKFDSATFCWNSQNSWIPLNKVATVIWIKAKATICSANRDNDGQFAIGYSSLNYLSVIFVYSFKNFKKNKREQKFISYKTKLKPVGWSVLSKVYLSSF